MKKIVFSTLLVLMLTGTLLAATALAQENTPTEMAAVAPGTTLTPISTQNLPVYLDQELATKHADFTRFAKVRTRSMDRNHQMAKTRMQIVKLPNGVYKARYHAIDFSTIECKVRRSSSKTIPYVAVLSYHELVLESLGESPEACKSGDFKTVTIIPNRQIFSHKKGSWR